MSSTLTILPGIRQCQATGLALSNQRMLELQPWKLVRKRQLARPLYREHRTEDCGEIANLARLWEKRAAESFLREKRVKRRGAVDFD